MILTTERDGSTVRYEPKEAAGLVHRLRNKLARRLSARRPRWSLRMGKGGGFRANGRRAAHAGYAKLTLVRALPATASGRRT
jgi:hypothetical protein